MGKTGVNLALVLFLLLVSSAAFAKNDNKKSSNTPDNLYIRIRWGEGGYLEENSVIRFNELVFLLGISLNIEL